MILVFEGDSLREISQIMSPGFTSVIQAAHSVDAGAQLPGCQASWFELSDAAPDAEPLELLLLLFGCAALDALPFALSVRARLRAIGRLA